MGSESLSIITFQTVIPLFYVLVLFFGILFLYRFIDQKWLSSASSKGIKHLQIQETLFLDPKRRLVRIQDQQTEYILLLSLHGDQVIHIKTHQKEESESPCEKA